MTPRTPVTKLPEPDLGSALIPKDRYLTEAYQTRERERLWPRVWNLVGPTSDVAEPGDYLVFDQGLESVIVVRGDDGTIRAFHNVCQHRGRRLREAGCGYAATFQCPYHLWTYDRDGKLTSVPDAGDFPQGDPTTCIGLPEVRCATWNGWVFVNLDGRAEPLDEYLGPLTEHLGAYAFESNYHLVEDISMAWACNWKVGVDAFNEKRRPRFTGR